MVRWITSSQFRANRSNRRRPVEPPFDLCKRITALHGSVSPSSVCAHMVAKAKCPSGASECDTYRPFRPRGEATNVQLLAAAGCEHDSLGESCPGRSVPEY